jgi:RHS repeat-associated protein
MQAPKPNITPPKQRPLQTTMDALGYDDSLSWAAQTTSGPDTNLAHYPRLMYYYLPDYLGHVEYITDLDGVPLALSGAEVYQYCNYTAPMSRLCTSKPLAQRCFSADWSRPLARWGETLIEEKATRPGMHFERPYRFNAKELDEETGLYYYGARYYNPMVSVWLGVDPKAHWYPNKTPYNFTGNNPIMLIDPNGMWEQDADGNWVAQKGDSWWTLHKDAGISWSAAKKIAGDFNQARGVDNWKTVRVGDAVSVGNEPSIEGEVSSMPSVTPPFGVKTPDDESSNSNNSQSSKNGMRKTINDALNRPNTQLVSNLASIIETFSKNKKTKQKAGAVGIVIDISRIVTSDNLTEDIAQTAIENVFGPAMPAVNFVMENGKEPDGLTNLNNRRMFDAYNSNKRHRDAYTQIMMYQNGTHTSNRR